MSNELREAITLLENEASQLDKWANESISGAWSTHQVKPMRERAEYLRLEVKKLKIRASRPQSPL